MDYHTHLPTWTIIRTSHSSPSKCSSCVQTRISKRLGTEIRRILLSTWRLRLNGARLWQTAVPVA
eukprot:698911-Rhodomonas_salina.2